MSEHRQVLSFPVTGTAITQGSKKRFRHGMVESNNCKTKTLPADRLKNWRARVALVAFSAMKARKWEQVQGEVELLCSFYFERKKTHYTKSGKVRKGAPEYPRGDVDKLIRAVGDALSGVVYKDDNQVTKVSGAKYFTEGEAYTAVAVVKL